MSLFSVSFLQFVVYGALAWVCLGVVILAVLLIRDALKKQIW